MIIQLGGVLFHDLLRLLHRVLTVQLRPCLVRLLVWMVVDEEIFYLAGYCSALVDGEARGEL